MSIKIRKCKITILLLFLTLFVGLDVYGQSNDVEQRASKGAKSSKKNPFTPLAAKRVVEKAVKKAVKKASPVSRTPQMKVEPRPVVRLTATFIATNPRKRKSAAMIEENGIGRLVSVGDKIIGMTIMEIQRGKVILNRGGKKCLVKLGVLPEKMLSDGQ